MSKYRLHFKEMLNVETGVVDEWLGIDGYLRYTHMDVSYDPTAASSVWLPLWLPDGINIFIHVNTISYIELLKD